METSLTNIWESKDTQILAAILMLIFGFLIDPQDPQKTGRVSVGLHGVIFQKIVLSIVTAVRTSNPTI
jgi:drug/metabolite transporter superfamily protein YnfA